MNFSKNIYFSEYLYEKYQKSYFSRIKRLKLISIKNLVKINDKTRDKKIAVIKDTKSKIIFLENLLKQKLYSLVKYSKIIKNNKSIVLTKKKNKIIKSFKLEDDQGGLNHLKDIVEVKCS